MTLAARLTLSLALLLAAPAAFADSQTAPAGETGTHAYTNPGKVLPCEFRSGTLSAVGLIRANNCDPNRDTKCTLTLEVVSIKDDSVRSWQSHDSSDSRCTLRVEDGRKRVIGPLWRKSEEGEMLVRLSGVVTDGVMALSWYRVLGEADGFR